jgi:quinoprotein glucose dehydrogenase
VSRRGKSIDAVAVATKQGFVFVFDRVSGDPIFPIEEKPFPASSMPGEESWPTQPIPDLPSFTRHEVTKETLNPFFSDSVKQAWYQRLDSAKSGLYTPLSDKYETTALPGALGGANFGSTGSDPTKGILYIMTQECSSIYQLKKVEDTKLDLSEDKVARLTSFYATKCQTCHGENMVGGVGPSLENVGHHMYYDEFQSIVTNGRGPMPGLVHVDEETLKALFTYLGGNPARVNLNQEIEYRAPDGPVIASGGAQIKPDEKRYAPMSAYPTNVPHPEDRYTTGYGIEWTGLLSPPWSSLVAYDLNQGTIKWRTPIGEDSLYVQGDKTTGAPNGTQRKGMVVTSTGVIFATAKGGKVYAIDAENGGILWETTLSHETNAQPSMYTHHGKQYLVINATADFAADSYDHSKKPNALTRGYVVYTLPD